MTVTVWPRCLVAHAATSPAGPASTTRTFKGVEVVVCRLQYSLPTVGLTAQVMSRPRARRPIQPSLQPMQGRMSSPLSWSVLSGSSGSANNARPMTTKSAFPSLMKESAKAMEVILPIPMTGFRALMLWRTAAAFAICVPWGRVRGGVTHMPPSLMPAVTSMASISSRARIRAAVKPSSSVSPPAMGSATPSLKMMGKSCPTAARTARTVSMLKRIRFSRLPP